MNNPEPKWKYAGVRVVRANELDINTPQTQGMNRAAAITHARAGAEAEPLSCVLCRSGQQPVVVNLDIPAVEKPEEVHWVDNIHPAPKK